VRRHIVLVGLPGSGKSTVGPLVAAQLDTHFSDVDRVIERATGLTVADLFAEEGEPAFRERERRAVLDALVLPPHVLAPGGGWAAQPGNLEETADRVLTVYLRVIPEVAAERLDGARDRPLVSEAPPARLRALLAHREAFYRRADATVDAGLPPVAVANLVIEAARRGGGW
jgi:shikimate kinase